MALINPTNPPIILNDGSRGRLVLGTNSADHFINLAWGDLVFGGNGPDVFDFTSNIGKLGLGKIAKVYGDTNAQYDPETNPTAHHVPGASINDRGGDFVNGAAGVWFFGGGGADTFIFHGRGDKANPGIFFVLDLTEGDKIGLDHELGLIWSRAKFANGIETGANGMIFGTLLSLDLEGESANPASPNAYMRAGFGHDLRGTYHPVVIRDTDRDGSLTDQVSAFVDRGHDGVGDDWILA